MNKIWTIVLLASILAILFLTFYFFLPLLDGIVMGVVFAYVAKPIKRRFDRIGKIKSSLIATTAVVVPISILIFYGIFQGVNQAIYLITHYKVIESGLIDLLKKFGVQEGREYVSWIVSNIFSILQSSVQPSAVEITKKATLLILNFFISIVVCFYSLADMERFVDRTINIVPPESREELKKFIKEIDETFESLWFGNFIVAMSIGLVSLPFFLYFNVPFAPLLSGLMFLAALIPIFAEWMIILPVSLYLLLVDVGRGLTFLIIGVIFLYIVPELILRPYFVGYTSRIHPLVLMLAFLGGGLVGGISGFFIAPMIAGLVTAIYNYYTEETTDQESLS
ncbi:AI-2E family transporter [Archaeoglobus neptunius]|uniref:AI-2E family transporter n=1 Tax=Archaeoglobus neptunius TaxID=2798580 RepID=UPI001927DDD4|nr:AI-2E family transporter [Archaeoglobus neptunius]